MTLIRPREIREMDLEARVSKLKELRADLMHERGVAAMGGAPPSPGKIRALRKSINRLITIMKEEEKIARGEKKVPKEAAK
jgi:large subunit ribosomal protein L29